MKNKNFKNKNNLIKKNINPKLENIIKIKEISKKIYELNKLNNLSPVSESVEILESNLKNQKNINSSLKSKINKEEKDLLIEGNTDSLTIQNLCSNNNDKETKIENNSLYLLNILKNKENDALIINNSLSQRKQDINSIQDPIEGKKEDINIRNYLNNIININKNNSSLLRGEKNIKYQFNKANNKPYRFLFDIASKILKLNFLSMGCLISKPIFKIVNSKNNLEFEHNTSITSQLKNNLNTNTNELKRLPMTHKENNHINNFYDFNPVISGSHFNSLYSGAEDNLELSGAVSPFFDFLIDNKNINKFNKLGLRKILSEFKFFRYFKYSGANTGPKQVISYSFTKNINRTNTLNSLDHTGSLLKVSISVILKYFFKIMGLALISKPVFIFSPNKVNIQISYFMNNKIYFSNSSMRNWNETVSTLSMGMQVH